VLAMIPMCLIAKIFRKKIIYIESFAKIKSPTATGKLLYKFADKFYVQWESMLEFYPKAKYIGGIY
ncbi:MAG: polysaccharide biosynthesis protein, partial [Ruminococcus sp.]|nr:polysaccharide biosynthesis protein [Ruminococcus sp.]